ncbi:MAG: MFS transporter [Anaerolineaceae bacterium]|nr:MFS transporter [Anaerolineaceae bacterium]
MIKKTLNPHYPRQFWLMFAGLILSTLGTTMIWPFLMIYASETLALPLAAVASLMTVNATAGLLSSIVAGPVIDRLGRKGVMVVGLIGNGLCYFLLSTAHSYSAFALILGASGLFSPLYRVGTDAMMADLFPVEKRADAFALLRMARNIGVATGPAIGGFVLAQSYTIGLYGAAAGLAIYGVMLLFFARETIPAEVTAAASSLRDQLQGYWQALRDKPFIGLVGAFTLVQMTTSLIWVLLSVYVKTGFGISEQRYGWLATTNALMVVFLQVLITRQTQRHPALKVMRWGAMFYIIAPLLIAFSTGYWGFWLAMVVMTLGELIVVPTASARAANLAPVEMRGRYMSLYGLTWNLASGISPVMGGLLSDTLGPQAPWFGGAVTGALAVLAFWFLQVRSGRTSAENS